MADALKHAPANSTICPAKLQAQAENSISRARLELSSPCTSYALAENYLKSALAAVVALGKLDPEQLEGSAS